MRVSVYDAIYINRSQYDEEGDRAALLEEVLAHLSESDQTLSSGQTRSTSRELAGILRNLKKIEHALEGMTSILKENQCSVLIVIRIYGPVV